MARLTFSTRDRFGERTSMTINADNAVTGPQVQAIADALDGVLLGSAVRAVNTIETVVDQGSSVAPNDVNATRFRKWQIQVQDTTTGVIYTHEIGTADASQLPSASSDFLDLSAGVGLALVTAIEAAYESPDGNAGTVVSIREVSRTGTQ